LSAIGVAPAVNNLTYLLESESRPGQNLWNHKFFLTVVHIFHLSTWKFNCFVLKGCISQAMLQTQMKSIFCFFTDFFSAASFSKPEVFTII
jgi:hypothetical protein